MPVIGCSRARYGPTYKQVDFHLLKSWQLAGKRLDITILEKPTWS